MQEYRLKAMHASLGGLVLCFAFHGRVTFRGLVTFLSDLGFAPQAVSTLGMVEFVGTPYVKTHDMALSLHIINSSTPVRTVCPEF